ncbi:non-ribosomal peptide synthetase [Shouchella lehensis]|uniref:Carrier domain-containing protein n=1 Tax=Shouchella lehensis G1 TaxID=1246626 RepID=A0A060LSK9_9BACI|nr:non-ribosomal peptide synthetase [Shouchella lehensis]AIC93107.1 hypothetical protein BleG1_0499 [Shouchella lehensis G1]
MDQKFVAFDLSHPQKRIWHTEEIYSDRGALNLGLFIRIQSKIDYHAMNKAINQVLSHSDSLRIRLTNNKGQEPSQYFADYTYSEFDYLDFSDSTDEENLNHWVVNKLEEPFKLIESELFYFAIIKLEENIFYIFCKFHHIIFDGLSSDLLTRRIIECYEKINSGSPFEHPMQGSYIDFLENETKYLRSKRFKKDEQFWLEEFNTSPSSVGLKSYNPFLTETRALRENKKIPKELYAKIGKFTAEFDISVYSLFVAVLNITLYRWTASTDIVTGLIYGNRVGKLEKNTLGMMVNTIPFKININPDEKLTSFLTRLVKKQRKVLTHQRYPFNLLSEKIQGNEKGFTRLFGVTIDYRTETFNKKLDNDMYWIPNIHEINDLSIHINEKIDICELNLQIGYRKDLFTDLEIKSFIDSFYTVLESVVQNPDQRINDINIISEQERKRLMMGFNKNSSEFTVNRTIQDLFENQVKINPELIAVVFDEKEYSYQYINDKANQLANFLQKKGVEEENLVGVCLERSVDLIITLIGILKAGCAYVPIDPLLPKQRIEYILDDASIEHIVTQENLLELIPDNMIDICIDRDELYINIEATTNIITKTNPKKLANVIYTSGSTGRPKGVPVSHKSLVNLLNSLKKDLGTCATDRLLSVTTMSFDIFGVEVYLPLISGATVILANREVSMDGTKLKEAYSKSKPTIMFGTPATWRLLLMVGWQGSSELKILCGGESWDRKLASELQKRSAELWNMYGPTETTICSVMHKVTEKEGPIKIGKPIENTELYVLDEHMQPVPIGVAGELYIGGKGVAKGYWNRPDLTEERFLANQFTGQGKIFRTGDRVRYHSNGDLEYLDRLDNQVQLRGYRIELSEIEVALLEHPCVNEVVVLIKNLASNETTLIAYVVGDAPENELRRYLRNMLPEFMVPSFFVSLKSMPLTSNGKVDRKSLPDLATNKKEIIAPRTSEENKIVSVWRELLNIEQIGIKESFFELGGNSLIATRVIYQLQETFDVKLTVKDLFEHPTVEELARKVCELQVEIGFQRRDFSVKPVSRKSPLPLSYAQQRLWFIEQLEGVSALYNIPVVWKLKGKWEHKPLEKAWNKLIERHESLRTLFIENEVGDPLQVISPHEYQTISFEMVPSYFNEVQKEVYIQKEVEKPFELDKGPLIRAKIFKEKETDWILTCTMHHIISDGWSINILFDEWMKLYDEEVGNGFANLKPLPIQYIDFAQWQRKWLKDDVLNKQLAFWREELNGDLPLLKLPYNHPNILGQRNEGKIYSAQLSHDLVERINIMSKNEGTTLFIIFMAAYQSFLSRYTGQEDILVGSPIANRNHKEIEGLIGYFSNTLVYRANVTKDMSFKELLLQTRNKAVKAYENQDVPFERIVEEISPERNINISPIFQTMFSFQTSNYDKTLRERAEEKYIHTSKAKYDLTLFCIEEKGKFILTFEYNSNLFDTITIKRLLENFEEWLYQITNNSNSLLRDLQIMSSEERKFLLEDINVPSLPSPNLEYKVQQVIEKQVKGRPDAVAAVCGSESITYKELNERANRLANCLRKKGVGQNDLVALLAERSINMLVGILGVLKAGGAYVPLDSAHPNKRLSTILANSSVKAILTEQEWERRSLKLAKEVSERISVLSLDNKGKMEGYSLENPPFINEGQDLANVFFTSGSTGNPKGAMVEHDGMLNHLYAKINLLELDEESIVAQNASHCFDISVWQFLAPLMVGGQVVIYKNEISTDPQALFNSVRDDCVTVLEMVPPMIDLFIQEAGEKEEERKLLPKLAYLISTGEGLPVSLLNKWREVYPNIKVVNTYGATECSDDTSHAILDERYMSEEASYVSLGIPIPNIRHYLLDEWQRPVPIGCIGEIYIAGIGVGRGYLNDPERTNENFIRNPFDDGMGKRMYKTGDLGRFTSDGELVFISRVDYQVKIRGYRIELGEIEAAALKHPEINQCVASIHPDKDDCIVAYVVAQKEVEEIRKYLNTQLPEYMIPEQFIKLEKMPLNRNGKIDRKALPLPVVEKTNSASFNQPKDEWEEKLLRVWEEVLGVSQIGTNENFFELGGHSLKTIQIRSRLKKEYGADITLKELFDNQTVSELAPIFKKSISHETSSNFIIPKVQGNIYPMSHAQQRLFLIDSIDQKNLSYNMPVTFEIKGSLKLDAFREAFSSLVSRHEGLRTTFEIQDGEPIQVIHDQMRGFYNEIDLSEQSPSDRLEEFKIYKINNEETNFDLQSGPLFIVKIIKFSDFEYALLMNMHHIIGDFWSWEVLMKDLSKMYLSFCENKDDSIADLKLQYKDYSSWQNKRLNGGELKDSERYWVEQFKKEIPVLELPLDYPRSEAQKFEVTHEKITLNQEKLIKLKQLSKSQDVTNFMSLLATIGIFISKIAGQEDIVVGTPEAGRNNVDLEGIIGFFVNTLPLKLNINSDITFFELLRKCKNVAVNAYDHHEYPFDLLVEKLGVEREISRNPLFSVMFQLVHPSPMPILKDINLISIPTTKRWSNFDLTIVCEENLDKLDINFNYRKDFFKADTIRRWLEHLEMLIEEILEDPHRNISEIPIWHNAKVLSTKTNYYTNTSDDYLRKTCVHQLFEEIVKEYPGKIAVEYGEDYITYQELDEKSNQLAHYLRKCGVQQGSNVAISLERSLEIPIALLGVMKAGGTYVPIDPYLPSERLQYMLEDSNAKILIANQFFDSSLINGLKVIGLEDINNLTESKEILGLPLTSNQTAYIIYTSGSTGKPKGVQVSHKSLVNLLNSMKKEPGICEADRVLSVTSISFDVFGADLYLPLITGATVILVNRDVSMDGTRLKQAFSESKPTIMYGTPATWRLLLMGGWQGSSNLKVLCGGESWDRKLATELQKRSAEVWNTYGPTETTITSTIYKVKEKEGPVKIGKPIENTELYVLDEHMKPVPIGVAGELYIGGEGVAKGYWNRPELTEERFIENLFTGRGKIYRTGDRVRFHSNGDLEYLGRLDNQVKIRGYRIEPSEIESVLKENPLIRDSIVLAQENSIGELQLNAYIVALPHKQLDFNELRSYCLSKLPNYMCPLGFNQLEKIPLTTNGKVDTRKLREATVTVINRDKCQPRNLNELKMSKIWGELLNIQNVGINDNFFTIGGHSLKALQMKILIQEQFNTDISMALIFKYPTISDLCTQLSTEIKAETNLMNILQHGSDASTPLILIHPHGGGILPYIHLVNELNSAHRIYGIQAKGYESNELPNNKMEDIVNSYVIEIRKVLPKGPYRLMGWSFGGTVAYEIARKLEGLNEKIEFLGLLDVHPLGSHMVDKEFTKRDAIRHFSLLLDLNYERISHYASEDCIPKLLEEAKKTGKWSPGMTVESIRRQIDVLTAHSKAMMDYRYSSPIQSNIELFCVNEVSNLSTSLVNSNEWFNRTTGNVSIINIGGNHHTMVELPHVSNLAKEIDGYLAKKKYKKGEGLGEYINT